MEGWEVRPVRQVEGLAQLKRAPGDHERVLGRAVTGPTVEFRKS